MLAGAAVFLGLVLYVPFLRQLFHLSVLHGLDLLLCLAAGALSIGWFEARKVLRRLR